MEKRKKMLENETITGQEALNKVKQSQEEAEMKVKSLEACSWDFETFQLLLGP